MRNVKERFYNLLARTPIQYFPVTVRGGLAKGARWTLFPYSSYWRGNTEMDVEAAIGLHGSVRGANCWDLGSHFGIYTVGMAIAVGCEGQVAAFEPDPLSFKRCQRHVRMNSLSHVKLFNAAVSNSEGTGELLLKRGVGASTSHLAYEDEQPSKGVSQATVKTVVLDKLVEGGIIRPAQFIKVDVEGHGGKALQGACKTITKYHPTLVMSFHSQWELNDTKDLLNPVGYAPFDATGKKLDWQESLYRTAILRV